MKNFTLTTIIALLLSPAVFSQTQREPGKQPSAGAATNQSSNNQLILLSPANDNLFNTSEGSKPVLFRWTAVVPKPKEPVTYRLKVWQLMQGQNAIEAMRNNQPIITKDLVNLTQTAISNLYTGPCKPPYLCDFIWTVEAILTENNTDGKTYAMAAPYTFRFDQGVKTDQATAKAQGDPVHGVDVKLGVKGQKN